MPSEQEIVENITEPLKVLIQRVPWYLVGILTFIIVTGYDISWSIVQPEIQVSYFLVFFKGLLYSSILAYATALVQNVAELKKSTTHLKSEVDTASKHLSQCYDPLYSELFTPDLKARLDDSSRGNFLREKITESIKHIKTHGFPIPDCSYDTHLYIYDRLRDTSDMTFGTNLFTPAETLKLLRNGENDDTPKCPELEGLSTIQLQAPQSAPQKYIASLKKHAVDKSKALYRVTALTQNQIKNLIKRNLQNLEPTTPQSRKLVSTSTCWDLPKSLCPDLCGNWLLPAPLI